MNDKNLFEDAPVIYAYTRAQAIEDGVLVDLTEWANETGFRIPIACTSTVWEGYIVPPRDTKRLGQSERGRAHDVLWMLYCAIRRSKDADRERLLFDVSFLQSPERHETVSFKAVCGPGDRHDPVLTIMLPQED